MPITFAAQRKLNKNQNQSQFETQVVLGQEWRWGGLRQTNISKIILNICSWHVGQTTFVHFGWWDEGWTFLHIKCESVRCMWRKPFCDITKY